MFIIEKKVQPSVTILFLQVFAKIQHVALILQSQFHNTRCQIYLCYISTYHISDILRNVNCGLSSFKFAGPHNLKPQVIQTCFEMNFV